ncbi:calcium-dependent phosphotriesterase [Penicillium angulare]|uniref:calcium-dependent phosphotriesterase n=1 Tax=Penicillium angulare TaxID=116970 RepID=UPI002541FF29|nr:calcium-dependent phosphotriesterase [Penicillium angulare]KAJ5256799.1 calcium-dependent phosphotriesterase [Penicillium angulare]
MYLTFSIVVLAVAAIWALRVHEVFLLLVPILRVIQPIEDFPYECERLQHPSVEGCEDIWLDHTDRKLYAACASIPVRTGWSPGGDLFNVSARDRADHISVIDIDQPGSEGMYGLRHLKIGSGYQGDLDLHGFDVRKVGNRLRFWLINHRPPVSPETGEPMNASKVGANSTIEIFDLDSTSETLEHVKTIVSDAIITPNDLAVDEDGVGFAVTNDHTAKAGLSRVWELFAGGGSISYCQTDSGKCHVAVREGCNMPNGIVNIDKGIFAVTHSGLGIVASYKIKGDEIIKLTELDLQMPLDNMSLDDEGNVFVAGFPNGLYMLKAMKSPYTVTVPATTFKIPQQALTKSGNGEDPESSIVKILEDRDGKKLPSTTVVVHDAKTERFFLAGVISPSIGICTKKQI